MSHLVRRALVCLALPGVVCAQSASRGNVPKATTPVPKPTRIVVGPEFLVSRDGDAAHVETMISANPRDPRNLLGGSIVGGRPSGGFHCKTYASHDGGQTWIDRSFPELIRWGGGDPQVAFTPRGTAIFTCLAFAPDETGRVRAFLYAWRSEDGGLTWSSKPADLGASYDHEMLVVDQTPGRFSGRIYLSALYGREYKLGLFRSEDDGRTWTGPVQFTSGVDHGVNVTKMVVFSDGDLLVTWVDFPITPQQDSTWQGSQFWSAISKDGGVTFTPPRKLVPLGKGFRRSHPDIRLHSDPGFAVDPSEAHRDRVYMVWSDFTEEGPRTAFVYSDDRGATWSAPRPVDASAPKGAKQFQPRIAVNQMGTIGISFYDTRNVPDAGWHEYFTASVDGGATFLPPVRISNESSRASGAGNDRLEPMMFSGVGEGTTLALTSGASRWANGGDYLGLTTDSLGAFHPFWSDARSGTFQLWTAAIQVQRPPLPRKPHPLDAYFPPDTGPPTVTRPTTAAQDVTKKLEFVFDPTVDDAASGQLELRIRLKNVSTDTIFGPVRVEVRGFGGPLDSEEERKYAPTFLNATNAKGGVGAVFDFSAALGTDQVLAPGRQTSAVFWRMRLSDRRRTPSMQLVVLGVLRAGAR